MRRRGKVRLFKDVAPFVVASALVGAVLWLCVRTLQSSGASADEKRWARSVLSAAVGRDRVPGSQAALQASARLPGVTAKRAASIASSNDASSGTGSRRIDAATTSASSGASVRPRDPSAVST